MKSNWKQIMLRVTLAGAGLALASGTAAAQDGDKRLRVASELQQAKLVSTQMPVYPVLARRGRIEGTVRLNAVIDREGKVTKVESVSGHPVLDQAAKEAVSKWRYKPTVLNGEAVEVVTTIDVVFKLS
jgi:protein TonB